MQGVLEHHIQHTESEACHTGEKKATKSNFGETAK